MWRNSKRSTADLGLELPPRTLTFARLHFTPAEHTFYTHILEKTRKARDALHQHQHPVAGTDGEAAGSSVQSPAQAGERALHQHLRVHSTLSKMCLCSGTVCAVSCTSR